MVKRGKPIPMGGPFPFAWRWRWPETMIVTMGLAVAIVAVCFALARKDCRAYDRTHIGPIVQLR